MHEPYLQHVLHPTTQWAARNPKRTLMAVTIFTFAILFTGLATNFHVVVDSDLLWTPKGVRMVSHRDYVTNPAVSGYDPLPHTFYLFAHRQGANVLTRTDVQRLFEALNVVRGLPGYNTACASATTVRGNSAGTTPSCFIQGVTQFWNHSMAFYQAANLTTDEALQQAVSVPTFPDGVMVIRDEIFGLPVNTMATTTQGLVESTQGLTLKIYFPRTDIVEQFETRGRCHVCLGPPVENQYCYGGQQRRRQDVFTFTSLGRTFLLR